MPIVLTPFRNIKMDFNHQNLKLTNFIIKLSESFVHPALVCFIPIYEQMNVLYTHLKIKIKPLT